MKNKDIKKFYISELDRILGSNYSIIRPGEYEKILLLQYMKNRVTEVKVTTRFDYAVYPLTRGVSISNFVVTNYWSAQYRGDFKAKEINVVWAGLAFYEKFTQKSVDGMSIWDKVLIQISDSVYDELNRNIYPELKIGKALVPVKYSDYTSDDTSDLFKGFIDNL